jgi:hypothetical protein
LVSLLSIISLAGTLVHFVPPPRTPPLAILRQETVHQDLLTAQLQQFRKVFLTGDFHGAATLAQQGYRDALRAREPQIAARFLGNLGGCRFYLHQYREAGTIYIQKGVRQNATILGTSHGPRPRRPPAVQSQ